MFEVGDVVYCTNNKYSDVPYTIENITSNGWYFKFEELGVLFYYKRFISEKEYQVSKRLEKINKIKNGIY